MKTNTLLVFMFLLFAISSHAQIVYVMNGNIFLKNNKGTKTQLTFNGNNSNPVLSPGKTLLAFVHIKSGKSILTGIGESDPTELWIITLKNKKLEKLLNPFDSDDMRYVIANISAVQFSNDSKTIFFLSDAWVTSGAVHKINIKTKVENFVAPGNCLEVIRNGKYKGDIKVNQHRYHEKGGSYNCDYILTPNGKEVAVLKDSCSE